MSSVSSQIQDNAMQLNYMLLQGAMETSAKIKELQPETQKMVYAQEGDNNFDEAMDENGDGTITYDEYMKYCEANAVAQYSENPGKTVVEKTEDKATGVQSIRPINIGKALSAYSTSEIHMPEAKIKDET